MTLPKLNTPTFTTTLPSTGKPVKYRPFLVKEEKILLIAMTDDNEETVMDAVRDIITNCTFGNLDVNSLTNFDLEWLFLQLHIKSKSLVKELKFSCSNIVKDENGNDKTCGHETIINYNLDNVKIKKDEDHSKKIMLEDNIGVIMRYPTFEKMKELQDILAKEDIEAIYEAFGSFIETIFEGENVFSDFTKGELKEFIENCTDEQFSKIKKFFETMPRLSAKVPLKCQKCGHSDEVIVEGLQSFLE
jgi:hypothetical protein